MKGGKRAAITASTVPFTALANGVFKILINYIYYIYYDIANTAIEYITEFPGLVLHPGSVYFDRMIL